MADFSNGRNNYLIACTNENQRFNLEKAITICTKKNLTVS